MAIAVLKNTNVKLDLLVNINMLLMVIKGIKGGIYNPIQLYTTANKKIHKRLFLKNRKSSYLKFWDGNNLYVWEMSQILPVNDFKWVEYIFKFNGRFHKKL